MHNPADCQPLFPEEKCFAKHMVLAHHGKLEYGSPKEPACIEALIVHMIDDLDSKVNAIRVSHRARYASGANGRF